MHFFELNSYFLMTCIDLYAVWGKLLFLFSGFFCNCIAATAIPILVYIHNKLRDYHLGSHMNHDLVPIYGERGYQ